MAGIGPAPFCAMLLADMGAHVIRIDRIGGSDLGVPTSKRTDFVARGRRSLALDLKQPQAIDIVLKLIETADALIEGFRPKVMERLGLGPDICLQRNPRLVYGRMTGFGQEGPLSQAAGHDINYIALTGALASIGECGRKPVPPLNLVGDYGGGSLYLAIGILAGIINARATGRGDVIDAAMVDGAASLMTIFYSLKASGRWDGTRGENILDGGAPWYDTYETRDGLYLAIGAIEAKFFQELARRIGLDEEDIKRQSDRAHWPALRAKMVGIFKQRSREEWCALLEGTDSCVTPVLTLDEAPHHAHLSARNTFHRDEGYPRPGAAPRFARAGTRKVGVTQGAAAECDAILRECGLAGDEISALRKAKIVA
ncbi:MAG: CoA transferase [Methylobacteriaceae bacterium]|nr:CoA transferase [Methylobacteriaceae bacterium]